MKSYRKFWFFGWKVDYFHLRNKYIGNGRLENVTEIVLTNIQYKQCN